MDRVIDFNEVKNRVRDEDIDKFESYMYTLYYKIIDGSITMNEFTKEMLEYARKNNITQDKFLKLQSKMMERYGFDVSALEDQLKDFGITPTNLNQKPVDYESARKALGFHDKYKSRLETVTYSTYYIKNDKNDIKILFNKLDVIISSVGVVDLSDIELNEFLCSYKKVNEEKELTIKIYDNSKEYQY